ncbi:hypothetical protein B0H13DRAFT_2031398 [Mycena leptocephala]|nr:hypothetical protein B0H13DRAFT_2133999 [Mycena leptocephala]KAJ7898757.1 hypothetical protein B0H13DRAFT_2031398 [Mycena leptocephala]
MSNTTPQISLLELCLHCWRPSIFSTPLWPTTSRSRRSSPSIAIVWLASLKSTGQRVKVYLLTPAPSSSSCKTRVCTGPAFAAVLLAGLSPAISWLKVKGYIYCHYTPAGCSFFTPLHDIYSSAHLRFEYPIPVLSSSPYTTSLFTSFMLDCSKVFRSFGPQQLSGYLGDCDSEIKQLIKRPLFSTGLHGRPAPRHRIFPAKSYVDAATQTDSEQLPEDDHSRTSIKTLSMPPTTRSLFSFPFSRAGRSITTTSCV